MGDSSRYDPFSALSNHRRRIVCRYFVESDAVVATFDDLVEHVVRRERHGGGECPEDHRKVVTIQLYHVDLPVLSEVGLVEFDPRSETVRYLGHDLVETVLREFPDDESVSARSKR